MRKTNTVMCTKYKARFLSIALKQPKAGPQEFGNSCSSYKLYDSVLIAKKT